MNGRADGTIWTGAEKTTGDRKSEGEDKLMNVGHLSIDDLKPPCAGGPNLISRKHRLSVH